VPALGERFDPERHEAMTLVPVSDPAQDGRVVGVMREAYSIGEDMLRPAGVAVGKLR
jgi:molecular chaperone GrpE